MAKNQIGAKISIYFLCRAMMMGKHVRASDEITTNLTTREDVEMMTEIPMMARKVIEYVIIRFISVEPNLSSNFPNTEETPHSSYHPAPFLYA